MYVKYYVPLLGSPCSKRDVVAAVRDIISYNLGTNCRVGVRELRNIQKYV